MPPKKLVRRARKSLKERRLNALDRDLKANLDKVELKKYRSDKLRRALDRKRGIAAPVPRIPKEVAAGLMNAELFKMEEILRARAGLSAPVPLAIQIANAPASVHKAIAAAGNDEMSANDGAAPGGAMMMIGLVSLKHLASATRAIPTKALDCASC
jgi:hypothetical protein